MSSFFSYNIITAIQQSSISIEHDNYPVMENAGKVSVCASYYGSQPLASDVSVTLQTLDSALNSLVGGSSQGEIVQHYFCPLSCFPRVCNVLRGSCILV